MAGGFDAVFSRFGVMFFADPPAAFRHIHSLVKPGGRMAFACWQDLFSNEWMLVPGAAVITVTGHFPELPEPGAPGPFSLADAEHVRSLLGDAGFSDVSVTPHNEIVALPDTRVESIVELSRSIGPVRDALAGADETLTTAILDQVRADLSAKVTDGQLRLTAGANIVSARA
jgi:SAM-dependent methyltransferase